MLNNGDVTSRISINKIDFNNTCYKITRNSYSKKLENSIKNFRILIPPLLFSENNNYIIISGHNRLRILKDIGESFIEARVIEKIDPDLFIKYNLMKCYDTGVGVIGKAKFLSILKNDIKIDPLKIDLIAKEIELPVYSTDKINLLEKIINLPQGIKDYIDLRDTGYKVVKNILRLPGPAVSLLNDWIKKTNMRVNIFKSIVELLLDLSKKNKNIHSLGNIDIEFTEDRRARELILHKELYKIRYPEYSELKAGAEDIIKGFRSKGIEIEFPEYMEGDEIGLSFKVNKRDGIDSFIKKFNNMDTNGLKKLLELL